MSVVVFLGPSLPLAAARAALDAVYLPPARQGDVYRAVRDLQPRIVGLVDGMFHQVLPVWHRELLWAMSRGVHVYGAASMGALRAAELASFGMRGIGKIARAYRDGRYLALEDVAFEDDDEVAVVHGPPELGHVAVSQAMVDIRETLARAADAGIVASATALRLIAIAKSLYYPERGYQRLLDEARVRGALDQAEIDALERWLPEHAVSQKRLDAIAMLAALRDATSDGPPPPFAPSFRLEPTIAWARFVAQEEARPERLTTLERQVLGQARRSPRLWAELRRRATLRRAALSAGMRVVPPPDAARRAAALDAFRRAHGLLRRADLDRWLASNGLDFASGEAFFAEVATLNALAPAVAVGSEDVELASAMLACLREDQAFAALAEAAAEVDPTEDDGTAAMGDDVALVRDGGGRDRCPR